MANETTSSVLVKTDMRIEDAIIKIISKYINVSEEYVKKELLDCNVFSDSLNFTSMMLLELLSLFEKEFGIKLNYDAIKDLNQITLRTIINLYLERCLV